MDFIEEGVCFIDVLQAHMQFIRAQVKENSRQPWLFIVIYGSPNSTFKGEVLEETSYNSVFD